MSSTEPPTGSVPPDPATSPASATPPPPPPPPAAPAPTGPVAPTTGYGAPPPPAAMGVPRPGELLDRFVARLLDLFIVGIVAVILGVVLAAISDSYLLASFITAIVYAALFLGYFGYLESTSGQTLGKQVMKLKTFGPDGHSVPTMEQAVKRNIWTGISILNVVPVLGPIIGFVLYVVAVIVCAVNINGNVPDRRTWFDNFAGGTQVMKIG